MLKNTSNKYSKKSLLFTLLGLFILTEIIDDVLDHVLGNSIVHSFVQLFLFVLLFFVVFKLFSLFYKQKISLLIPRNLKVILEIIKDSEIKGVLVNQTDLIAKLKITKPTMKKRLKNLLDLNYISIEIKGNHKYIVLTDKGNSMLN